MLHKHILVGPIPIINPSGQAICFQASIDAISDKIVFDANIKVISNIFRLLCIFPFACLFSRGVLYFTGSRSLIGFFRDFWIVLWGITSKKKLI